MYAQRRYLNGVFNSKEGEKNHFKRREVLESIGQIHENHICLTFWAKIDSLVCCIKERIEAFRSCITARTFQTKVLNVQSINDSQLPEVNHVDNIFGFYLFILVNSKNMYLYVKASSFHQSENILGCTSHQYYSCVRKSTYRNCVKVMLKDQKRGKVGVIRPFVSCKQ